MTSSEIKNLIKISMKGLNRDDISFSLNHIDREEIEIKISEFLLNDDSYINFEISSKEYGPFIDLRGPSELIRENWETIFNETFI